MLLSELAQYLDQLLDVRAFADYAPNGVQVEGRPEVHRLVAGVTASQALLDAAVEAGADVVLVHHGYFWKGEDPRVIGMKARRLRTLLEHGVSLLAYHLPLDAHPELGNNAQLGRRLGLTVEGGFSGTPPIGLYGRLEIPLTPQAFAERIATALGRPPVHVAAARPRIETVAWCTGGAQRMIDEAAELGVDAYITGEISEPTVHVARERDLHFFSAGHHATERYGAMALAGHLADKFGLDCRFVDIDSPA